MRGRPQKNGVDYFPVDVDFFDDDKIKLVRAKFGGDRAAIVALRLLSRIYRQGYYYTIDADKLDLLALDMGPDFSHDYILSVTTGLVNVGFFDKRSWETDQTLTSTGIQERYMVMTKRRNDTQGKRPYWLLPSVSAPKKRINVSNNSINVDNNSINTRKKAQRKVKESKSNNIITTEPEAPSWYTDFEIYLAELRAAYEAIRTDTVFIAEREEFLPGVDIVKALKKMIVDYWGTSAGWEKKKSSKSKSIDWKRTFINSLNYQSYHVAKQSGAEPGTQAIVKLR